MAVFIVLWSCLFTTELKNLQKNKSGHTNCIYLTERFNYVSFLFSLDKFGLDQNSKNSKFGHVDHNEDSVQSNGSEVDRQLLSMMSENSVDFTSKFAKLASAVVGSNVEDT